MASDAQVVAEATLAVAVERVEIYQHGVHVLPAFLQLAEEAYRRLEALTGRALDTATLGPRIRIYVSNAIRVSHVWRGYNQPSDPKGIVLLSARAYEDGLKTTNATYVHEMAHLFTWRYHSHTLREGLADFLALQVHPKTYWKCSQRMPRCCMHHCTVGSASALPRPGGRAGLGIGGAVFRRSQPSRF